MWRRFLSRVGEGHSWHPVGGDQGGCSTPCSAADARSRVASADVRSGRLRTPCPGRSPRQPCLCFVPAPSRYPESPAPKELGCPRYSSRGGGAGWRAASGAAAGPQPAASYVVSPWAMVRSVACRNGRGCKRNISDSQGRFSASRLQPGLSTSWGPRSPPGDSRDQVTGHLPGHGEAGCLSHRRGPHGFLVLITLMATQGRWPGHSLSVSDSSRTRTRWPLRPRPAQEDAALRSYVPGARPG